ncbi:hypothetical protein QYM36_006132, partial [Artemia franciscana]
FWTNSDFWFWKNHLLSRLATIRIPYQNMEFFTLRQFIFMLVTLPKVGDCPNDSLTPMNDHKCALKEDGFFFNPCINDDDVDMMLINDDDIDIPTIEPYLVASSARPEDEEEEDNVDEEVCRC